MFEAMLVRDAEARPTALDLLSMEACHPYFQSFNEALSDHLAKTLLKKDAARIHQASREASTAKHIAGVDSYEAYESAPPSSYGSREVSWTQTSNPDAHLTPKQRLAAKKQRKADEEGARLRENAAAAQAEGARSRARNKNRANPESAGHWGGSTGKGPDHWITEHPDIFPGGYAPDSTTSTAGMATNKFSVFTAESPVNGMPAREASKVCVTAVHPHPSPVTLSHPLLVRSPRGLPCWGRLERREACWDLCWVPRVGAVVGHFESGDCVGKWYDQSCSDMLCADRRVEALWRRGCSLSMHRRGRGPPDWRRGNAR